MFGATSRALAQTAVRPSAGIVVGCHAAFVAGTATARQSARSIAGPTATDAAEMIAGPSLTDPVQLEGHGLVLEPMEARHAPELADAATDGDLWNLFFTSVPRPEAAEAYIEAALAGRAAGHMNPWVVREAASGLVVGSSRFHDIDATIDRVEIGYTWYRRSRQRTATNTATKLVLLGHAFGTLRCGVVGFRTDNFNFQSQRAIAALGAKRDGVIRHHGIRPDGSVRDTHMFSIVASEWFDVKRFLEWRLVKPR